MLCVAALRLGMYTYGERTAGTGYRVGGLQAVVLASG
jgi:hypothetical protein